MIQTTEDAIRDQLQPSDLDELTVIATGVHGTSCTPAHAVNRHIGYAAQGIDRLQAWLTTQAHRDEPGASK
jgi:hypothetical protein